jgi:hypothetical protein
MPELEAGRKGDACHVLIAHEGIPSKDASVRSAPPERGPSDDSASELHAVGAVKVDPVHDRVCQLVSKLVLTAYRSSALPPA